MPKYLSLNMVTCLSRSIRSTDKILAALEHLGNESNPFIEYSCFSRSIFLAFLNKPRGSIRKRIIVILVFQGKFHE